MCQLKEITRYGLAERKQADGVGETFLRIIKAVDQEATGGRLYA